MYEKDRFVVHFYCIDSCIFMYVIMNKNKIENDNNNSYDNNK